VLIYKATELVNFAQGDLLMLGAFVAYMAVVWWGLDYWVAFAIAVVSIGAFGAVLDKLVLRQVIGQPQFAVVMLTIGLGAMFRTFASVTWGSEIYTLPTPFGGVTTVAGVTLSHQYLSIIMPGRGHAGDLAEPARRLLHGHPGEDDLLPDLGDFGRRRRRGRRAPGAGDAH
jgi:branched-chain amino acid transport system permease protein